MSERYRLPIKTLRKWVDRISYKEGFRFSVYEHEDSCLLLIKYDVIDSRDGKSIRPMMAQNSLNIWFENFDAFIVYILECIRQLEYHETLEFFKIDGKQWKDPHELVISNGLEGSKDA